MSNKRSSFTVLYRWRLHPGAETSFVEAWEHLTKVLKTKGALGARLHRGTDGLWYAYAQWPSDELRQNVFAQQIDPEATKRLSTATAECLPEVVLEIVADYLEPHNL